MGSATYVGGSHLTFTKLRLEKGRKLNKYKIFNHNLMQTIGEIHWRGGWRQYVSQTLPGVDMSHSCNAEVNKFIAKLMGEWRKKRVKNRVRDVNVGEGESQ